MLLALGLIILGWAFDWWGQPQIGALPFEKDSVWIEVVGPQTNSRVLGFPASPSLGQVLEAAGLPSGPDIPNPTLENKTKVLIVRQGPDDFKIVLQPMSSATLLGLGQKLNINQAAWRDLTLLPGIGKVAAARIHAARQKHGSLTGFDDLMHIKGIGPETVRKLRLYVAFED